MKLKFMPALVGLMVGLIAAWFTTFFTDSVLTIACVGILGFMFASGKCVMDDREKERQAREAERKAAYEKLPRRARRKIEQSLEAGEGPSRPADPKKGSQT
ncbi:MAG: hypothetical protein MR428_06820 [Mesosutterella sp.]|nr:hypothetical protein [Mesosutterella sp.]